LSHGCCVDTYIFSAIAKANNNLKKLSKNFFLCHNLYGGTSHLNLIDRNRTYHLNMESNWKNFLKNLGEWRGSFAQVSLDGEILSSTPSILSLEQKEEDLVLFRLRRFASEDCTTPPISDIQQEYRSLGRQIIFFDTGAFSKGSLQIAPFSDSGAEYGFVGENRRLRFVQLYDNQGNLGSLTLIREFRSGTDASERPPLTVEQLLGTWEGTACTAYPDWRSPDVYTTRLEVEKISDDRLQQKLSFNGQTIVSTARISGNKLYFEGEETPRQILLLPDGTSCNTPLKVSHRQPFFLEVGWLNVENERQRIIRRYSDKGEWIDATHVIERKI
jgi:hypothetical protein